MSDIDDIIDTRVSRGKRTAKGLAQLVKAWGPEVAWSICAVMLVLGLVILLNRHDDRPLPQWPVGLSLNTAVALFATVLHTVIVLIVSEAISQVKWNRFAGQEHRLQDLYNFDKASRGPWGSFMLVLRGRGGILGTLAAVIFISGLATSTITQSAIVYSTRMVHNPELHASLQMRKDYGIVASAEELRAESQVELIHDPDPIEDVVFQAVYHPSNQIWHVTEPKCPAGDCYWESYDSLAFCYDLRNITEHLRVQYSPRAELFGLKRYMASLELPNQDQMSLENQWATGKYDGDKTYSLINWTSPWPNLSQGNDFKLDEYASFPPLRESAYHSNTSDILRSAISQWVIIYRSVDGNKVKEPEQFRAAELVWHFCINTFNVSVQQGQVNIDVLSTSSRILKGQGYGFDQPLGEFASERNYTMIGHSGKSQFMISDGPDYTRLDRNIRNGLSGSYSSTWTQGVSPYNEFSRGLSMKMFEGVENRPNATNDQRVWQNLHHFGQLVADSLTDHINKKGSAKTGKALFSETYVRVRWQWLALIAGQTGLAVFFFAAVATASARLGIEVVKSSNMAELFANHRPEGYEEAPQERTGLRRLASDDQVAQLRKENDSWVLKVSKQRGAKKRDLTEPLRRYFDRA